MYNPQTMPTLDTQGTRQTKHKNATQHRKLKKMSNTDPPKN